MYESWRTQFHTGSETAASSWVEGRCQARLGPNRLARGDDSKPEDERVSDVCMSHGERSSIPEARQRRQAGWSVDARRGSDRSGSHAATTASPRTSAYLTYV